MENLEKKTAAFAELLEIIATLRVECPWDKKQTMESMRSLSIEEVYELGDAILAGDMEEAIQNVIKNARPGIRVYAFKALLLKQLCVQ